jgi:hypothetical protein
MHGGAILFPQTIVAIAGKEARVRLVNAGNVKIGIKKLPDCIEPLHLFVDGDDLVLTLLGKSYHPGMDHAIFTIGGGEKMQEVTVQVRTFTEKEFFVVFCLQANYHKGWDPSWLPQFYPELANGEPGFVSRKRAGKVGPGVFGSSYMYLYDDAEARAQGISFTPLERIFHDKHVPVTWLVDKPVAEKMAGKIKAWHEHHGDTYAVVPTSNFQDNAVNFNTQKTLDETKGLLKETLDGVASAFVQNDYPMYASVAGVDQWIGSVGTNFVHAAMALGLKGLWGMGWDHDRWDKNMYHRGAPWDAFKPSKHQFRIPARENERFELFLFQWTVLDVVNTTATRSVFSTDPDNMRINGITRQVKPHYMMELLYSYLKSMKYNDHFVFLVHQDDHDAHHEENNLFIKQFLDDLFEENLPGVTFATLEEVAQWLAIKYPDNEVPSHVLELDDPLDPDIRKVIREKRNMSIRQVFDPADDRELELVFDEHFPLHKLPPHIAFYDRSMMFLSSKPHRLPVQMWDYRLREQWGVAEEGQYPLAILPKITIIDESTRDGYKIKLVSNKFFSNLPWIVWDPSFKIDPTIPRDIAVQTAHAAVFFINVQAGENTIDLSHVLQIDVLQMDL